MSSLVSTEFWKSELHTSYWLPMGDHRVWDDVGVQQRITFRSGDSSTAHWRLAVGLPGHIFGTRYYATSSTRRSRLRRWGGVKSPVPVQFWSSSWPSRCGRARHATCYRVCLYPSIPGVWSR